MRRPGPTVDSKRAHKMSFCDSDDSAMNQRLLKTQNPLHEYISYREAGHGWMSVGYW